MSYYLLLSRSITHAQRMSAALERAGITARFFRAPMGLTTRGCSYAVRIAGRHFHRALALLRQSGLHPVSVFCDDGEGALREVVLPRR